MTTEVETISPLVHRDADRVCITLPRVLATCSRCERAIHGQVHGPLIAYGLFHAECCPCRTFEPNQDELNLLMANRRKLDGVTARAEMDQQRSDTLRQRWRDAAFRAEQSAKRAEAARLRAEKRTAEAKTRAERERAKADAVVARAAKREARVAEWQAFELQREAKRCLRPAKRVTRVQH
jgi:hypothetical protein